MTVDIGQPTHTRACTVLGCGRTVGPYHDRRQADMALDEHKHIRHRAVRAGGPYVSNPRGEDQSWPIVGGE